MDCFDHLNCTLVDILYNIFDMLIYLGKLEHSCTIAQFREHRSKHRKARVLLEPYFLSLKSLLI
jgi:hypothetical protein